VGLNKFLLLVSSSIGKRGDVLPANQKPVTDKEGLMNGFNAGSSSDPELELELSDGDREGSDGTSSGSTTPDPNTLTPGSVIVRGDGNDDDGQ
jgi:hypothetical protein